MGSIWFLNKKLFQNNIVYVLDFDMDGSKKLDLLNRALQWRPSPMNENTKVWRP